MKTYKIERISYNPDDEKQIELRRELSRLRSQEGRPLCFFLQTFGCQQNENDSEKIKGILLSLDFLEAASYEEADLVLINTCSIRENADTRLYGHLGKLKSLKKDKPSLVVGVCGCLPTQKEQNKKIGRSFPFVNMLFGPQDIHRLEEFLHGVYCQKIKINEIHCGNIICESIPLVRERKFRALVSIMFGCNNFCSYCVVPSARERERSRFAKDILAECKDIAAKGIPEVLLLGQNVNAWGFDLRAGRKKELAGLSFTESDLARMKRIAQGNFSLEEIDTFPKLLAAVASINGIRSIRYMSPHPRDFDGEMLACLAAVPQLENHLHLPVQSGSDRVLKAMNRHYTIKHYLDIVDEVRKVRPEIAITTDIMVGFPGETEEDFNDTLDLVDAVKFSGAFSFIYSARPGTPAAVMPQIPSAIQHERFDRLIEKLNRYSEEEHQALLGTKRLVLLEGTSKNDPTVLTGRDSEFHLINIHIPNKLSFPKEAVLENGDLNGEYFESKFIEVKITGARTFSLEAEHIE